MALKIDYVVRETATNLAPQPHPHPRVDAHRRRVAVAGRRVAACCARASTTPPQRWKGGIEFIVFLNPDAHARSRSTPSSARPRRQPRGREVDVRRPGSAAYERVQAALRRPARVLVDASTPTILPASFRVRARRQGRRRRPDARRAVQDEARRPTGRRSPDRDASGLCSTSRGLHRSACSIVAAGPAPRRRRC